MDPSPRVKRIVGRVRDYLDELTRRLRSRLGDRLLAAWVIGSTALGDFDPTRSDIDVQAIASERLTPDELRALAERVDALIRPYIAPARDDAPPGSAHVHFGFHGFPDAGSVGGPE